MTVAVLLASFAALAPTSATIQPGPFVASDFAHSKPAHLVRMERWLPTARTFWDPRVQGARCPVVSWGKYRDPFDPAAARANFRSCTVSINLSRFVPLSAALDVACAVVVHEYGHLQGFGHNSNPQSVMYSGDLPRQWGPCRTEPEPASGPTVTIEQSAPPPPPGAP